MQGIIKYQTPNNKVTCTSFSLHHAACFVFPPLVSPNLEFHLSRHLGILFLSSLLQKVIHVCGWKKTIQKLTCIHPLCTCLNRCKICSEGCETSPNDFYIFFLKRHLIPAAVVLSSVLKSNSSRLWRCLKCMVNGNHRWLLAEVSLRA